MDSKKLPAVFIVLYVMYVHGCDDNNVSDDEVFIWCTVHVYYHNDYNYLCLTYINTTKIDLCMYTIILYVYWICYS